MARRLNYRDKYFFKCNLKKKSPLFGSYRDLIIVDPSLLSKIDRNRFEKTYKVEEIEGKEHLSRSREREIHSPSPNDPVKIYSTNRVKFANDFSLPSSPPPFAECSLECFSVTRQISLIPCRNFV